MNTTAASLLSPTAAAPRRTPARARRVLNLLERLPHGQLDLEQPDGRLLHLPRSPNLQ
ncbi:MAG: SAM-dependent methyltransferase, partial [Comamonas sp.]